MLDYVIDGGVARVTMNRPEKRNALNDAMVTALGQALGKAASDEAVRVVVLAAEGGVFSAGADLKALEALQAASTEENLADSERMARLFEAIHLHPKPIVARVHGHAIAGGCGLAVACDFSIVATTARLGFTEVRIGFVPALVSAFVVRRVGDAAARDLLLTGRLVGAGEAERMGLITRAVEPERIDGEVDALVAELLACSASAVALTKRVLAQVPSLSIPEALRLGAQTNALARTTADFRAGVASFLQREAQGGK